ncbi:hypothetical protein GCM10025873_23930 [Demequina sediminis]|nr:hypothetical protein GCM10025873_23930 [Demequina sediminis]
MKSVEGAQREGVVEPKDRVDRHTRVEETVGALGARRAVPQAALDDERGIERDPVGRECRLISEHAQGRRAHGLARVRAHHGDPATALVDEVLGGRPRRVDVVHRDVVPVAAEDALAEHHERIVHLQRVRVVGAQLERREDQPVRELAPVRGQHVELVLAVRTRLLDEDHDPARLGGADHGVGELREVRQRQLREREADDSGATLTQAARREVHAVAELVDRLLHLVARGGTDVGVVVHDVRDGLHGHARERRDVVHRHVAAHTCAVHVAEPSSSTGIHTLIAPPPRFAQRA